MKIPMNVVQNGWKKFRASSRSCEGKGENDRCSGRGESPWGGRTRLRPWILAGLICGLMLTRAEAGGGPSGTLVIYDPSDPNSTAIANYYQQLREIPEINMVPYSFLPAAPNVSYIPGYLLPAPALTFINDIKNTISNRNLQAQINSIVLAGNAPTYIYGSSIYNQGAITAALSFGPNLRTANDVTNFIGGYNYNLSYRGPTTYPTGPFSPTIEMRSDVPFVSGSTTNF